MKRLLKIIKVLLVLGLAGGLLGAATIGGLYLYLEPSLPAVDNLKEVRYQVPLRVYSAHGQLIAEFGEKRRIPLDYTEIPQPMVHAFLAAEDDNFFHHPGVDVFGLGRAAIKYALTGKKRQGGSTITMQVARNFYLTPEKSFKRKFREIFLALRIEKSLSKQEILALYLNKIYLGNRAYGVGAAAQIYYGRSPSDLTLAETAMIAGLPKAPSAYNPLANPTRAKTRRTYVLGRMRELGQITEAEYREAVAQPLTAKLYRADVELQAPYVAEMVRAEMVERYGQDAYTAGFDVHTTVQAELQTTAQAAVRRVLVAYDLRHGYRGPEQQLKLDPKDTGAVREVLRATSSVGDLQPAMVSRVEGKELSAIMTDGTEINIAWPELKWARRYETEDRRGRAPKKAADIAQVGDLIRVVQITRKKAKQGDSPVWALRQIPKASGALVALDPDNGAIRALVGGYDFYQSKFNRVTQAKRQPGSGFKAFIYSAALANGYTPASIINDAPVVFDDPSLEGPWRPANSSGKFFGPTRLRFGLTKSRNLISIRLLRAIGVKTALEHVKKFGINTDDLPANLSLALGSGAVTPMDMARGYAVLANGGYRVDPYLITRIEHDGKVEFEARPATVCEACEKLADKPAQPASAAPDGAATPPSDQPADAAPSPSVAPRVLDERNRYLMVSMMQDVIRAGTARRARVLGRKDLAGKTGTTNDQRDAWFNGFNRDMVAVAWVGFDDNSKLGRGEVGGRAALPAWIDFMRVALKDKPERPPKMPEGIVTVRIDKKTGLRARAGSSNTMFEVFREENLPPLMEPPPASLEHATADGSPIPTDAGGATPLAPPNSKATGTIEDLF